jgi:hypothetical protein
VEEELCAGEMREAEMLPLSTSPSPEDLNLGGSPPPAFLPPV